MFVAVFDWFVHALVVEGYRLVILFLFFLLFMCNGSVVDIDNSH